MMQPAVRVFGFLFQDQVRPLEVFSCANLLCWALVFMSFPDLLHQDAYSNFEALDARVWAFIFTVAALVQLVGMVGQNAHTANVRFLGMALASGAWAVIAANFLNSGTSTTANANYVLLAVGCALAGVFLGWKSQR